MIFLSLSFFLVLGGCQKKQETGFSKYFDDGRAKPTIALLPLKSKAMPQLPWNVIDELETNIKQNIMQIGNLYVLNEEQIENSILHLKSNDLLSEKNELVSIFQPAEFVVQMELVDHHNIEILKNPKVQEHNDIENVLNLKVRLMVIDIRKAQPKVILHEIIEKDQLIDSVQSKIDYKEVGIGSIDYYKTPVFLAHHKLCLDISDRIAQYIQVAKSKTND
jgi:hypothetical protein